MNYKDLPKVKSNKQVQEYLDAICQDFNCVSLPKNIKADLQKFLLKFDNRRQNAKKRLKINNLNQVAS